MICTNELTDLKCHKRSILEPLLILLAPFAPHIAEELWNKLGHPESISKTHWPELNEALLEEQTFEYPVSFNGKLRFKVDLSLDLTKEEIEQRILQHETTAKYLEGKIPEKIIVVPNRIINVVV